ncbi:hypothetical protein BDD12DRAFT_32184 [Trichophaea hybrida]|nr:hypothetical protein BDD12DRAFT_32184 [Trichophaea hybrida]
MRVPRIAFAIALPVVSFLAPVLGVGNAAALPRDHDQGAPPDSPKFYFPRQIKRQLGPFVNITAPHITPPNEKQPSPGRSSSSTYPDRRPESSSGGLDEFLSSLLSPTGTPSKGESHVHVPSTGESNIHVPSDPNIDTSPIPTDDIELGPSRTYSSSSSSIPDDLLPTMPPDVPVFHPTGINDPIHEPIESESSSISRSPPLPVPPHYHLFLPSPLPTLLSVLHGNG